MIPTLDKPAYGSACNSCGRCCLKEQCPLSVMIYGTMGRCPAIVQEGDGTFVCGMLKAPAAVIPTSVFARENPAAIKEAFSIVLGAGLGCDARFESDVIDDFDHEAFATSIVTQTIARGKKASPAARQILTAFSEIFK